MFGYEPEYIYFGVARIACYDIGRGHPLILLHGNGEDSSYWNAQISEFTRFMRVIAVDSRGHGASDSGTKGLSFDLMAQDLKHILDVKGIKKAFFLGFSDGGNLAIKFALRPRVYCPCRRPKNGAESPQRAGKAPTLADQRRRAWRRVQAQVQGTRPEIR